MSVQPGPLGRAVGGWLSFWFPRPPLATLALMRIGVGLVLLYVLLITAFDLEIHFSREGWAPLDALRELDPMAWPFSVFNWVESGWWLWAMHIAAMTAATAFLLGVVPAVTGTLSVAFLLSYAHRNPALVLGLDGLLLLSLVYLTLTPCARRLGVLPPRVPHRRPPPGLARAEEGPGWSGLALRVLQVHLALLYFLSGLGRLSAAWLTGAVLWAPRAIELGQPFSAETLQAHVWLVPLLTHGMAVFELLFAVLVWNPRLRYAMLATAVLVHLGVGLAWELTPFNLLMLVLNLSFVPPAHLEALVQRISPFFALPWASPPGRA